MVEPTPFDPMDVMVAERQRVRASAALSVEDDPDKAARALQLSDVTGVHPDIVYGDLDHHEKQAKIAVTSDILRRNKLLSDFAREYPLVDKMANDDWGHLDKASQTIKRSTKPSLLGDIGEVYKGIWESAKEIPGYLEGDKLNQTMTETLDASRSFMRAKGMPEDQIEREAQLIASSMRRGQALQDALFLLPMVGFGPVLGAYRHYVSKPLEEVAGIPVGVTEGAAMVAGAMLGIHEMRAGKEPMRGVHPEVDKLKEEQTRVDLKNLKEMEGDAEGSALKERSPQSYADFVDTHTDMKVQVDAQAVARLYGDKLPVPGDGILGDAPNIQEQLADAVKFGGHVEIPLADWLTKVEAEVRNELHDDVILRPGALSKNDLKLEREAETAKRERKTAAEEAEMLEREMGVPHEEPAVPSEAPKPKEIGRGEVLPGPRTFDQQVSDWERAWLDSRDTTLESGRPHEVVREAAGLRPLFSLPDRKLILKPEGEPGKSATAGYTVRHEFDMVDETGKSAGFVELNESADGKRLWVDIVGDRRAGFGPGSFGPTMMRRLLEQVKELFPEAEELAGWRVSGARKATGGGAERVAIRLKSAVDDLDRFTAIIEGGDWVEFGEGVEAKLLPRTEAQEKAAQAVADELGKIVPKHVNVQTAQEVRLEGQKVGGVYVQYVERIPQIIVDLTHTDPIGAARHEAIHHLRQMQFFTPDEWRVLERAARSNDWIGKHDIEARYEDQRLSNREKLEEAIADEFWEWSGKQEKAAGPIHAVFERIKAFLQDAMRAIHRALGREVTAEELFQMVRSGEIGERTPRGPIERTAFRPQAAKPRDERAMETRPAFETAPPGMTKERYERIIKLDEQRKLEDLEAEAERVFKKERRRQTAEWKENRADMQREVAQAMGGRPDIAADTFLRTGRLYGDQHSTWPKLRTDRVPEAQRGVLAEFIAKDGVDPDSIAGMFGYSTGDEMVRRITQLEEMRRTSGMAPDAFVKRMVEAETDRQMEAKYGRLSENIMTDVMDQVLSQTELDRIHEELIGLAEMAKAELPLGKAELQAAARERFGSRQLSSINSDQFLAYIRKATHAVEDAFARKDWAKALRAMEMKEMAFIYAKEAKEVEKEVRTFDQTARTFSKWDLPQLPQEYANWIHSILARIGKPLQFGLHDLNAAIEAGEHKNLLSFVQGLEADRFGMVRIPVADFLFDERWQKPYKDFTVDEFRAVKQSIDELAHFGRDEKKLTLMGEAEDFEARMAEMTAKLATFPAKKFSASPEERWWITLPKSYIASMVNIETLLNRWNRNDPRGIFNRLVYDLAEGSNLKARWDREYSKLYRDLKRIEESGRKIESPLIDPLTGEPVANFTKLNASVILSNYGNASNWTVFTKGWKIDPKVLQQWLFDRTAEGFFTKDDWDRAEKLGRIFDKAFDQSKKAYSARHITPPESIDLLEIDTPFGKRKGWYHPLIKDAERVGEGKIKGDVWDNSDYGHVIVPNGYTKRRTGAIYPVSLTYEAIPSRLSQMLHDAALGMPVSEVQKVFRDKRFHNAVVKHYGSEYADGLIEYLRGVAGSDSINSKAMNQAMRVSEYFRQNVISSYIGFNPYTAMKHGPTAWFLSVKQVGPMFFKAMASLYGKSEEIGLSNKEFVDKWSEEVQRRKRYWQDTVIGQHKDVYEKGTLRESVIQAGSWLVAQSDMFSVRPTWLAAYWKAQAKEDNHGMSVAIANAAVRKAHGSTAVTNLPLAVMRASRNPLGGWLTSLYGFFGTMMQRRMEIAYAVNDAFRAGKRGELTEAGKHMADAMNGFIFYVAIPTIIEEYVTGLTTDDRRGFGAHLLFGAITGLGASTLYLRDFTHAIATGQEPQVGLLSSPLNDLRAVLADIKRGDKSLNKKYLGKTIKDFLTVLGEAKGVMPREVASLAEAGVDLYTGQAKPKTFQDWRMLLTRGKTKQRVVR